MLKKKDPWTKLNKATRKAAKTPSIRNLAKAKLSEAEYLEAKRNGKA